MLEYWHPNNYTDSFVSEKLPEAIKILLILYLTCAEKIKRFSIILTPLWTCRKKRERNSHMRWYVLMSNVKTATKLGRRGRFSRNHNNYGSATPEEEGKINVGSLISLSQSQARARMSERLKHTHMYTHTHPSQSERSYETWRINQAYILLYNPNPIYVVFVVNDSNFFHLTHNFLLQDEVVSMWALLWHQSSHS